MKPMQINLNIIPMLSLFLFVNLFWQLNTYAQVVDSLTNVELFQQNEMAFMYIDDGDRTTITYREDGDNLIQTSTDTYSTNDLGANNNYGTDVTGGAFFGKEYGEAAVYAFVSQAGQKAQFSFDLRNRLGDDASSLTTVSNVFTAGIMNGGASFQGYTPLIHAVAGNFTGDGKDELFVIFDANDNTYKSQLYQVNVSVDMSDMATISVQGLDTASINKGQLDGTALRSFDATALDIDGDNYDELAITFWKDAEIWVEVFDIDGSGQITSRYSGAKKIFDTPGDPQCLIDAMNNEQFNFTWVSLAIAGGDFVSDTLGDELVVGANFTLGNSDDDDPEANQGLYLFPLREINGPDLLIPNWCDVNSPISINSSDAEDGYPPGLNMEAGDVMGDNQDELVVAARTGVRVYSMKMGTAIGGSTPLAFDQLEATLSIPGAAPSGEFFPFPYGPGAFADHFLSVGNIDQVGLADQVKEEIFVGSNTYQLIGGITSTTIQYFNLNIFSVDDQGQTTPRGSLSNLFSLNEENQIDPRRFSISLVDFDGGGIRLSYILDADKYNIAFGLPPLIDCGGDTSGFQTANNVMLSTIQNVIDATPLEKFHIISQDSATTLGLFVDFKPSIVNLEKMVKVRHYRTQIGTDQKELVTIPNGSFTVGQDTTDFSANIIFDPVSASTGDALVFSFETTNGDLFAIIAPLIITGVDYTVPVLGSTVSPQIPYLILHDPPGDMSTSEFLQNVEFCRETSQTITEANGNSSNFSLKFGIQGSIGFINTIDYEFSTTFSTGFEISKSETAENVITECMSVTSGFQTSDLQELGSIGENADIFIGFGERILYGIERFYSFDPNNCKLDTVESFAYASDPSNVTRFAKTRNGIINEISELQALIDTIVQVADPADKDSVRVDSANAASQIRVWQSILDKNQMNIDNPQPPSLFSEDYDGTITEFYEKNLSTSTSSTLTYEVFIEKSAGIETVLDIGGSGFSAGTEFTFSNTRGIGESVGTVQNEMLKYTLADDDEGDKFVVDIYRDPDYGTHIFKMLNGSKTSCPWEGLPSIRRDQPVVSGNFLACSLLVNNDYLFIDNVDTSVSAILN